MDPATHRDTGGEMISVPGTSRSGLNDSQQIKREKAAERQRRKRQRDKSSRLPHAVNFLPQNGLDQHQEPLQAETPSQPVTAASKFSREELSAEESARRDRIRASARERQRKHRSKVKQRKLRELGQDMGNEIMPGMDEAHYRVGADGHYQAIISQELQHHPHAVAQHESVFPPNPVAGGQTFASTLLLSFSSSPLLKQHLLRTLSMTNEELASLEPILAEAWDQWDHQRRLHWAEQAAKAAGRTIPGNSIYPAVDIGDHAVNPYVNNGDPHQSAPNEFRARFHRSLVAPSPFRTFNADAQTTATTTPTSTGSGPPTDPIDPHLTAMTGVSRTTVTGASDGPAAANLSKSRGRRRGG